MPVFRIELINPDWENFQSLDCRHRLFYAMSASKSSLFLLSETFGGRQPFIQPLMASWSPHGPSYLPPDCRAGICWRSDSSISSTFSPFVPLDPLLRERVAAIAVPIEGTISLVVSVYAPVKMARDTHFFAKLLTFLSPIISELDNPPIFLGGDWNCVLNPKLDNLNYRGGELREAVTEFSSLLDQLGLLDVFRRLHPDEASYTNRSMSTDCQRRLDRLYVSRNLVDKATSTSTKNNYVNSTHRIPMFSFQLSTVKTGPGVWRLPVETLLAELDNDILISRIQQAKTRYPADPIRCWEAIHNIIREFFKKRGRELAAQRKKDPEAQARWELGAAQVQARVPPQASTGMSSSAHVRAKIVRSQELMRSIQLDKDSPVVSAPADIIHLTTDYYRQLYSQRPLDEQARITQLSFIPQHQRLSAEESADLESPFTERELYAAVLASNNKVCPGSDGIPGVLYRELWDELKNPFTAMANAVMAKGRFSSIQRTSVIRLIPKARQEKQFLTNWRPLSLINSDLKIITQAINRRLLRYIDKMVHPNQSGFIPHRFIGHNITDVQSLVTSNYSGYLLSLDFEKAYDRLSRVFIFETLRAFGFGPQMLNFVRTSLYRSRSFMLINGFKGQPFRTRSGVRQGDPMSPTLFALSIEPLLSRLRAEARGIRADFDYQIKHPFSHEWRDNPSIGPFGIIRDVSRVGRTITLAHPPEPYRRDPRSFTNEFTVLAYADDLIVAQSTVQGLERVSKIVNGFCDASCSKLNMTKTLVIPLSNPSDWSALSSSAWSSCPTVNVVSGSFRYLGVPIGRDISSITDATWNALIEAVSLRLRRMLLWDLPLACSCWLINVFCFSKVVFLDPYLPASPRHLAALQKLAENAIRGSASRLPTSAKRLCRPLRQGGFGLWDLPLKLLGARMKRMITLLATPSFSRHLLLSQAQEYYIRHKYNGEAIRQDSIPPWYTILRAGYFLRQAELDLPFFATNSTFSPARRGWRYLIKDHRQTSTFTIKHTFKDIYHPLLPFEWPLHNVDDFMGNRVNALSFTDFVHKLGEFQGPRRSPLAPTPCQPEWLGAVWRNLCALRLTDPWAVQAVHLFLLHNWAMFADYQPSFLNKMDESAFRSPLCALCRHDSDTFDHFWACPTIVFLRDNLLGFSTPSSALGFFQLLARPKTPVPQDLARFFLAILKLRQAYRSHVAWEPGGDRAVMMQFARLVVVDGKNPSFVLIRTNGM